MDRQVIRDFQNAIIGYVETDKNGNKTVRDFYNRILGYYDAKLNLTRDFYNAIVARGDAAVNLIYQEEAKRKAEQEAKKNASKTKK